MLRQMLQRDSLWKNSCIVTFVPGYKKSLLSRCSRVTKDRSSSRLTGSIAKHSASVLIYIVTDIILKSQDGPVNQDVRDSDYSLEIRVKNHLPPKAPNSL